MTPFPEASPFDTLTPSGGLSMAGLGLGPTDFALFDIDDPDERAAALERALQPKLLDLGGQCRSGLVRVAGKELHVHPGRLPRRKGAAPQEVLVAFSESDKGYRGLAFLAVVGLGYFGGSLVYGGWARGPRAGDHSRRCTPTRS